jgi:hypothetical protein
MSVITDCLRGRLTLLKGVKGPGDNSWNINLVPGLHRRNFSSNETLVGRRCGEESQSAPAKGGVTCLNPARRIGHFNYFWPQLPRPDGSGRGFRIVLLTSGNSTGVNGTRQIPEAFISREFLQISFDIVSRYRNGTCGTTARSSRFKS